MIYMHLWEKNHPGEAVRGLVIYPDGEVFVDRLPEGFDDNLHRFMTILAGDTAPRKSPGSDCRFCPITKIDCRERVEVG